MTSETPFKNLHRLESFKSTGYKLWVTEWLGERERERELRHEYNQPVLLIIHSNN